MQPRSLYAGTATIVCSLLAITLIPSPRQHVAVLERLAPRIERAQSLTPASRDVIVQLLERVRDTAGDPRHDRRRENAIQRVTDALNVREGSVGQGATQR